MRLPELAQTATQSLYTQAFLGYNALPRINDGEFANMENLTSDQYPMMSTRKRRGTVREYENPRGMIAKAQLCVIDGNRVYYGGQQVPGIVLDAREPKQLVGMGAYVCIFPDNKYFNSLDLQESGSMNTTRSVPASGVTVCMCRQDGRKYEDGEITISSQAPSNPNNGDLWLDTSGSVHDLKQYSEYTRMWVQVATVYAGIFAPGIGEGFSEYDTVTLSGLGLQGTDNDRLKEQAESLNGDHIIYQVSADSIVIAAGALDQAYTPDKAEMVTVERQAPLLDYVCEAQNRIWGCRYGKDIHGEQVNEIYCCAMGDFKNWYRYMGVSTDSYAVSVGSDGPFTGCATMNNSPVFYKENCLHRVTGTMPSNYQVVTTACRGIQEGSWRSPQVVNEVTIYKSKNGVMLYDGTVPVSIGDALGPESYYAATAGTLNGKYYISMQDKAGDWSLFVYDSSRGLWHREDGLHVIQFATLGEELYMMAQEADGSTRLLTELGTEGEQEGPVAWDATFGVFGYEVEPQKYLGRINLRVWMEQGAWMELLIQYDSSGEWESLGRVRGKETGTFNMPVIPQRCDHCQLRLKGVGAVRVYSVGRVMEYGSDYWRQGNQNRTR